MSVQSPSLRALSGSGPKADPLQRTLRAAARRIRALRLVRFLSLALGFSALAGLILVGLSKLRLYPTPAPWAIAALVALGLVLGAVVALLPRLTELDVARLTERRADLKERLSSAVEFQRLGIDYEEPFYGAQLLDANRHAENVDLKALYPLHFPRSLLFGLLACLGLFLIYFLPGLPLFWSPQQKADAQEVKVHALQIIKLARDTEKAADQQKLPETKKAAEEMRKLGEAMRRGRMTKKESLVAQAKLTRKMEEQQRRLADKMAPKSLQQAGKQFKKSMEQMQQASAQKPKAGQENSQPKKMQQPGEKASQQQQKESEAMKQARAALQQMQQAMAQQSPQQMQQAMQQMAQAMQMGSMNKQEMQQLAQAMQQMAQALQNTQMNLSAQQLQQLAQAMQGSNSSDASNMQQLAEMMSRIAQGMGKASGMANAGMDAKALAELMQAFREGRMTMAGGPPGVGPGRGNKGWGGTGHPSRPMTDPGITKPRITVAMPNHTTTAIGKSGSVAAFQKYLLMANKHSKYLPNGQIKGSRSQNGQELSMSMMGNPNPAQSNSPYYQAAETNRRQAESALDKENIPATMKKQVHDYFDSITPP